MITQIVMEMMKEISKKLKMNGNVHFAEQIIIILSVQTRPV